jgi:hypothetical protein
MNLLNKIVLIIGFVFFGLSFLIPNSDLNCHSDLVVYRPEYQKPVCYPEWVVGIDNVAFLAGIGCVVAFFISQLRNNYKAGVPSIKD